MIRKFDIYVCDLGDPIEGYLLGKCRPCVILQSFNTNDPRAARYVIAPIRTEHSFTPTRENLEEIVQAKRNIGRIYIPIEMEPENFRFIDITELRCIPSNKIQWLKCSIVNIELQNRINKSLLELLFTREELGFRNEPEKNEVTYKDIIDDVEEDEEYNCEITNQVEDMDEEDDSADESTNKEEKQISKLGKGYTGNKTKLPIGFSVYYELYKQKKITKVEIGKKFNKSHGTIDRYFKIYESRKEQLSNG